MFLQLKSTCDSSASWKMHTTQLLTPSWRISVHEREENAVCCSVERYSKTALFDLFPRLCISSIKMFHPSVNLSLSRCQMTLVFTLNIFKKTSPEGSEGPGTALDDAVCTVSLLPRGGISPTEYFSHNRVKQNYGNSLQSFARNVSRKQAANQTHNMMTFFFKAGRRHHDK